MCVFPANTGPNEWFEQEFEKAILDVDMRTTPGVCRLAILGTTNGQILGWDGMRCDPERLAIVKMTAKLRYDELLSAHPVADPLNVFIKPEPHTKKKMLEERYRLISGVSLTDALVDRVMFGWLNRQVLNAVLKTPAYLGWTPVKGGWKTLKDRFGGRSVLCLDKSSWDWTVQEYLVDIWKMFVKEMMHGHPDWWARAVDDRFDLLFKKAVFQFKDGTQVLQGSPGIMKSGCLLTLLLNSVSQSLLHYIAMIRMNLPPRTLEPISVGDDTLQLSLPWPRRYVSELESLGTRIKGLKNRHYIEFVGLGIDDAAVPAYWKKHLFKLTSARAFGEKLAAFQRYYANDENMLRFLQALALARAPDFYVSKIQAVNFMNTADPLYSEWSEASCYV